MAWRAPKQSRGAKLFASFLGGGMCFLFGWALYHKAGGLHYRRTSGTVIESRVREKEIVRRGTRAIHFFPLIRCRYRVGGKTVENRYCHGEDIDWFAERSEAEKVVARYPVGRECPVYYHPERPADSRLDPPPPRAGDRAPRSIGLLLYLWGGWMLFQGVCIAAAPGLVYWYVRRKGEPDRRRVGRRRRRELVQQFWERHAPLLAVLKFVYGGFMFTAMGGSLYLGIWLVGGWEAGLGGLLCVSVWAVPFIAFGLGFWVYAYVKYQALSADAGGEEGPRTGPAPEPVAVGEIPESEEEPAPKRPQSFPVEHTCPQCGETFTIRKSGRYKCRCGRAFSL